MRLPFLPEAVEELDWEVVHLEIERPHWGDKLYEEVRKRVDLAADHPELGQAVPDLDEDLDVRRFVIPKFGISVIVALMDGEQTVIAIAPGRKRPGYCEVRGGRAQGASHHAAVRADSCPDDDRPRCSG